MTLCVISSINYFTSTPFPSLWRLNRPKRLIFSDFDSLILKKAGDCSVFLIGAVTGSASFFGEGGFGAML